MSLSICQNCVYQNDVTMYTTYCINGICDLCGHHAMLAIVENFKKKEEAMKSYYLITEIPKQGFYVKARYLGEFNDDEEAADFVRKELGSSLAPDEFILTEEEIREDYGDEAAEILKYIEKEGYIIE